MNNEKWTGLGLPPIGTKAICKYCPDEGLLLIVAHDLTGYPTMALTCDESGYWGADEHHWDPVPTREPKPGEVWVHQDDGLCMFFINTIEGQSYMIELGDQTITEDVNDQDGWEGFVYAAPSVESYYAREFLKSINGAPEENTTLISLLMRVKKSARVDTV